MVGLGTFIIGVVGWLLLSSLNSQSFETVSGIPTPLTVATVEEVATALLLEPSPTANIPTTVPTVAQSRSEFVLPNIANLQEEMYRLVNDARAEEGLSQLAWDTTASRAGQYHTEEMVQFNYFSHWNQDGLGPDHRYTQVGGQHAVMENLHAFSYTYENGQGAPIEDWLVVIENAHTGLMNSPGHRVNILDPAHTHVGIGMAYNSETGQFRLAQEFTNQYVRLTQPLPLQVVAGTSVVVQGAFSGGDLSYPLLSVAYEPFPAPLSIEALNQTGSYGSAAASLDTYSLDLTFNETITLAEDGQPGFYHIRLFVDVSGQQALVVDHVVSVR